MPGRGHKGDQSYRYGYNGKEKDPEGMGGGGSTYDYGFRIYNPSIGKFLSVDPIYKSFPWYTPYQFAGNKPIVAVDMDGAEDQMYHHMMMGQMRGTTKSGQTFDKAVENQTQMAKAGALGDAAGIAILLTRGWLINNWANLIYNPVVQTEVVVGTYALISGDEAIIPTNIVNGKIGGFARQVFRGTSKGFLGGRASLLLNRTSTTPDPVVATLFAVEAKNHGEGIVEIATAQDLKGVKVDIEGNVRQALEKEVALELNPREFSEMASIKITADEARAILKNMDINIPARIKDPTEGTRLLEELPRLTEDQVKIFFEEAKKVSEGKAPAQIK